jgi:succinate dehydrogenase/fumarate reductase-like Fe-S protein
LAAFQSNYRADGLSSVSEQERHQLQNFGGCIACGLCDRDETRSRVAASGAYSGLMSVVLAASRSMPDYAAALRSVAHLTPAQLSAKEQLCPTRVPIAAIVDFIRAKAAAARVSLPVVQ